MPVKERKKHKGKIFNIQRLYSEGLSVEQIVKQGYNKNSVVIYTLAYKRKIKAEKEDAEKKIFSLLKRGSTVDEIVNKGFDITIVKIEKLKFDNLKT